MSEAFNPAHPIVYRGCQILSGYDPALDRVMWEVWPDGYGPAARVSSLEAAIHAVDEVKGDEQAEMAPDF